MVRHHFSPFVCYVPVAPRFNGSTFQRFNASTIATTAASFGFERCHIDRETILHVGLEQSIVGFVDFLDRNDFDIRGNVIFTAKIKHLLSHRYAANRGPGKIAMSQDEVESGDSKRL